MKKIIIEEHPWQTRAVVTRDGKIQNIYFASHAIKTLERVFIKGIITTSTSTALINLSGSIAVFS